MIYLISKIFHRSLLVNLLVNFQNGFGDPRPQPIWFFWPNSIKTKILAPESALGAKHFKSCVILGHPTSMVIRFVKETKTNPCNPYGKV